VLVAFNVPSGVRVFRINPDFTLGVEVVQPDATDYGVFAHQIRITPDNKHAILVTRGVNATKRNPEEPGALKIFTYHRGVLFPETSIAPNGGFGFGPRHLDFHPDRLWVYVSLERQNKLYTYQVQDGILAADPAYQNETLACPERKTARQVAGAIHIHPNGRFIYVANRADGTIHLDGGRYFAGGENNIAVFEIDPQTGEPTLIQHADTGKVYPRTFDIDPCGRLMVVQNTVPVNLRDGSAVAAGITTFRIGEDGRLTFVSSIDVGGDKETMQWLGLLTLPELNAEASICPP
jgi:6-phosphogluconolactonase (cycloisomerase 2 family)